MLAPRCVAIVRRTPGSTRTAIAPVGSVAHTAQTSTPADSSSATRRRPRSSSPTRVIRRAGSESAAAQAQKLAAWPPPPMVMTAGESSSGRSSPSGTMEMSSRRSPIDAITSDEDNGDPGPDGAALEEGDGFLRPDRVRRGGGDEAPTCELLPQTCLQPLVELLHGGSQPRLADSLELQGRLDGGRKDPRPDRHDQLIKRVLALAGRGHVTPHVLVVNANDPMRCHVGRAADRAGPAHRHRRQQHRVAAGEDAEAGEV